MSGQTILLLGATGFVGRNLAVRLGTHGHRLLCLVRSHQGRQEHPISKVPGLPAEAEIIPGDLTRPRLGLSLKHWERLRREVDEVWHGAALLNFSSRRWRLTHEVNVLGTQRLLEFLQGSRVQKLHYWSTAYVAGQRRGVIPEAPLPAAPAFKNVYEQTKWQAETLVWQAAPRLECQIKIFRPSIILGGLEPQALSHTGLYQVLRFMVAIRNRYPVSRFLIPGEPQSGLNLVPLDFITATAVTLAAKETDAPQIYHLTNPTPTANPEVMAALSLALGLEVRLVPPAALRRLPLEPGQQLLLQVIRPYLPYLLDDLTFIDHNTRTALQGSGLHCPRIDALALGQLLSYYRKQCLEPGADEVYVCRATFNTVAK